MIVLCSAGLLALLLALAGCAGPMAGGVKASSQAISPLPSESVSRPVALSEKALVPEAAPLTLADKSIEFVLAQSELSGEALTQLREVASRLSGDRGQRATLIGYTDYLGSREYSVALATKRVNSVAEKLIALGVQSRQLQRLTRGYDRQKNHCAKGVFADTGAQQSCGKVPRRVDIYFAAQESR